MAAEPKIFFPANADEVALLVKENRNLLSRGANTKPALSTAGEGENIVDLSKISGILEYDPQEFTISALAGTPVREIEAALAEHGQYLPFDPPLTAAGATWGGALASGLSGPGRRRFGGIRDFVLGVRFIDGRGDLILGGGKVVKNAAGFDFPKLMAGSLGRLGILIEITFKVFPRPNSFATLDIDCGSLASALEGIKKLNSHSIDLEGLELEPPGRLLVRIGGFTDSFPERIGRLRKLLGQEGRLLEVDEEPQYWQNAREFSWAASEGDGFLVKAPMTLANLERFDAAMGEMELSRRYSSGACMGWIAGRDSGQISEINSLLKELDLPGVVLRGNTDYPLLGALKGQGFLQRIKEALDPENRFLPYNKTTSASP